MGKLESLNYDPFYYFSFFGRKDHLSLAAGKLRTTLGEISFLPFLLEIIHTTRPIADSDSGQGSDEKTVPHLMILISMPNIHEKVDNHLLVSEHPN